ncbi:MAG: alpha/beta fold hydrolase [Myxococcales bacterium]
MKRTVLAALLVPAAALAAPKRPSQRYSIEQFMATTRVSGASFSADEKRILFSSNESGVFNAYSVPVTGGKAVALTSSKDTTYAVSYFPKDDRILYTRDSGGDEQNHLYLRNLDGSEKDLTPGKLKARFFSWARDLSAFYVETNERDPKFFDFYRYDAKTLERKLLFQNPGGYDIADITDDEKWIALAKTQTTTDSDIYLANVATKELKHITPHKGEVSNRADGFDPANAALFFRTDEGGEFAFVRKYVLATGKFEDVEKASWDVMYTTFSWNGKYRVTAINDDGRTVVHLRDGKTDKEIALPKMPEGDITSVSFSRSERLMSFYASSDRSPSNLYVLDFPTGKVTRLTDTLSKEIDPEDLVASEVVRFKSFDGMAVPNIYYKPLDASPEHKAPALVWVHGGPGGQTRKGYSALIQYLVNHGYVVLGINNRGSSGYGKTFFTADDQKHGREPLWDCVEAKKWLSAQPYVDGKKIGIIGGSYGGYMVLAALAFQPEVFDVGVDIFGVSNWLRTLQSIPPYWESFRLALYKEIGDPVKDEAMLKANSPLFHADKIRRPLLVLQGQNDPRVIKPESDEIVDAVKKNHVPVEYVVFPDEGHGFTKKANEVRAYSTTLEFLDKYLRAEKRVN